MAQGSEKVRDNTAAVLDIGVELRLITAAQADEVRKRREELKFGSIFVSAAQVMLERKFITPVDLKKMMLELESRRRKAPAGSVRTTAAAPATPKKFGQYELLETLSDTGRNRVFKARDTVMDRLVVLKVLPPNVAKDHQWYERFRREMQMAGKLSHPNIVTTYGASEVDGTPLMIMEFVEGLSLGERLEREGNIPEKTAWLMVREVAKALAYAAQNNILHRDIKPENILCSRGGKVKIIDMGLSKSTQDDTGLTAAGTTVGTPFYISPEQARGTANLDARTDIYSLGCTAFHMLTGSVPFMREALTDVMLAHTQAARPDPRDLIPEISEASAKLTMRMMAIKPEDRPGSADSLVAEIDLLLPNLPEPDELVRPNTLVTPSEVEKNAKPAGPQKIKEPSLIGKVLNRCVDWLSNLFN
jgi:serine/threonine protein kinase